MAEYNEQSGYIRQVDKPTSTYNAHQDEFGFKEGNENANSTSGYGDVKEGGAFDKGTSETAQFETTMGSVLESPSKSNFDKAPHGMESVPAGDGWSGGDISATHGVTKDGLVNKIKKKLPGHHHLADGTMSNSNPNDPPPKSIVDKVKELPGHLCGTNAGV